MSLILDALRRAEREHPRDLARRLGAAPVPRAGRRRAWKPLVAALALAAVLALAGIWWLRPPAPGDTATVTPAPAERPAQAAQPPAPPRSALDDIDLGEPTPSPAPLDAPSAAPFLDELPPGVREAIPAMTVNTHVWSDDPARRFVMIDMRRYRDGDAVSAGLTLVRVLPEGAEMDWRGTRFRLARR